MAMRSKDLTAMIFLFDSHRIVYKVQKQIVFWLDYSTHSIDTSKIICNFVIVDSNANLKTAK